MRVARTACLVMVGLMVAAPAGAQISRILKGVDKTVDKGAKAYQDTKLTETEEQQLGADVSAKLRQKYGVVQDAAVHRYVTLAGTLLAQNSTRPKLRWTFIVLDTDGINAFAAPGGYIHITRGALALMKSEAELAGVLGHEITHVTAKHTVSAIEKSNLGKAAVKVTRLDFLADLGNKVYSALLDNAFSRSDEEESDETGVKLADKVGYAPSGLGTFLARLADRNKGLKERSGFFASHPEITDRVDALNELIADDELKSLALVQPRYARSISYKSVAINDIPQVAPPAGSTTAKAEPEKKGGKGVLGLGGLNPLGREKSSDSTIASAGSRGVNPDRDAKGGPNKALVVVTVTAADVAAFRKGIVG